MNDKVDLYSLMSREEISAFKQALVKSEGGLRKASKLLLQPENQLKASMYPTTNRLYRFWVFLGYSHIFFFVIIPVILFFLTRWYWSVASILFDLFVLHTIHKAVNLELFTRVYLTDQWMEEMNEQLKTAKVNLSKSI